MSSPASPAPTSSAAGRRRSLPAAIAVLALTALLIAGAAALDPLEPAAPPAAAEPAPVPAASAGAWYCPVTAEADETAILSIAAVGDEPAAVVVDRHEEDGVRSLDPVEIPPGGSHELVLDDGEAEWASTVRWTGGPVVAVWRVEGPDVAGARCESAPAPRTYVTGLDTAAASESTLHLLNPFGTDAVVRVTFGTDTGPVALVLTDNVLVPAGQSAQLELGEYEPQQRELAVTVEVLAGRVVAQGAVALAPTEDQPGPTGRAVVPGADAADLAWAFAYARADGGSESWLSVFNPGEREAAVEVRAADPAVDADALLAELAVPPGGVARVDLADASESVEFGLVLESINDVPVVAARLTAVEAGDGAEGVAASVGERPAERWALVGGGTAGRQSRVALHNPGGEQVTVSVDAGTGTPAAWDALTLEPNEFLPLTLAEVGGDATRASIPVLVEADGPVTADLRMQVVGEDDGLRMWTAGGVAAPRWEGPRERPAVVRDPDLSTRPAADQTPEPAP